MWGTKARMSSIDSQTLSVTHGRRDCNSNYTDEISPYSSILRSFRSSPYPITGAALVSFGSTAFEENTDNSCYYAQFLNSKNDALFECDQVLIRPIDQSS
jgi:hypothetical protein